MHESQGLLTNTGRALIYVDRHPDVRLRDLAVALDVTERTAFGLLADVCHRKSPDPGPRCQRVSARSPSRWRSHTSPARWASVYGSETQPHEQRASCSPLSLS